MQEKLENVLYEWLYGYVRSSVLALCIEKETKLKFKSIFYRIWINVRSDKSVVGGRDYQVHFKYKYGSLGLTKFLFCLGNDKTSINWAMWPHLPWDDNQDQKKRN